MRSWQATLLNIALMQAGWFACVLGAVRGLPWVGPPAVAVLTAAHLRLLSREPRREGVFIALAAVFGFFLETGLSMAGAHRPVSALLPFPLSPLWMTALWANFATLLDHSMRWLRGRPLLAAVIGAVGGPPAYLAGAELGAASIHGVYGILLIGAVWAAALPLLSTAAARALEEGPGKDRPEARGHFMKR